ncbi:MAG: guanine deaminase [Candidatus Adiutrix sp.]
MNSLIKQAFLAHTFQAATETQIDSCPNALILIDKNGLILKTMSPSDNGYEDMVENCRKAGLLNQLKPNQYLLPGFVDLHLHAPQWPQAGKALDLPLYQWLHNNTFPLEARFSNRDFAYEVYDSLVQTLLLCGTTTATYFATIHPETSLLLAEICLKRGQRALVGKVAMDYDCPPNYSDGTARISLNLSEEFIKNIRSLIGNNSSLVQPIISPRFIPCCSDDLLKGLGVLAQKYNCHIQSHCSESDWEHHHVFNRFGHSDARALANFGLLNNLSLMAHCNFLSDEDLQLFQEANASVAHCPLSNFYFAKSVFPLKKALNFGVKVGLGSDISGGPSPFILDSCRSAMVASMALESGVDPRTPPAKRGAGDQAAIDFRLAFWLATVGGGQVLGLPVGKLASGYAFDALVIEVNKPLSPLKIWPDLDSFDDILQKIIYNATPQDIVQTWVAGQLCHTTTSTIIT